mmetsp:Transcript_28567/g.77053  ORF Transcript_28567/g.77053 Transcript_28567/m.77053 type:complete len:270 (-) Transcript_28567:493-1302(-)
MGSATHPEGGLCAPPGPFAGPAVPTVPPCEGASGMAEHAAWAAPAATGAAAAVESSTAISAVPAAAAVLSTAAAAPPTAPAAGAPASPAAAGGGSKVPSAARFTSPSVARPDTSMRCVGGWASVVWTDEGQGLTLSSMELKMRVTARAAASLTSAMRSAPTKPGVRLATFLKSKFPSNRKRCVMTWRILVRAASEGMPSAISRSKRPARLRAGSSESGRFDAPITTTCLEQIGTASLSWVSPSLEAGGGAVKSSMHVSIWATMRRSISR